ncbi:MAG: hypothetical protein QGH06_02770 [Lutibacter sp.]|nr:hypothetical protein [Lutibacter sp.]
MNESTIEIIFSVLGAALTLLTVYGAFKLNRKWFLSGICYFSFLPIIGEAMAYNATSAPVHIVMIVVFIAQFLLARPDKNSYGPSDLAATALATKIGMALLVINVGAAVYVLCLDTGVPAQYGYFHTVIALTMLYLIAKRFAAKGVVWNS